MSVLNDLQLLVQRASDLYYWNEGTTSWQAAAVAAIIPADISTTVRAKAVVIANLESATPDAFIITVQNDLAAGSSYQASIFHVKMTKN